jgi:DNA-binding NarL/FixJ family response regulator
MNRKKKASLNPDEVAPTRTAIGDAPPKVRIRVLIADDHGIVREGLVSMIRRNKADMTVVGEATNGREAVDLWKEYRPDVTLLDLRMPELDGVDAIKAIRANDVKARIIVLTTFDGDEDVYRAIQAGAKGYLLKDVPREALMDCIRRVHAGEPSVPKRARCRKQRMADKQRNAETTKSSCALLRPQTFRCSRSPRSRRSRR